MASDKDSAPAKGIKPTLSRFDADLFTRNLHYTASFWEEHGENFEAVIEKMMKTETLLKVCENAELMCLAFTERTKWLPTEYNKEVIYPALEKCKEKIQEDKMFISKFAWAYFNLFIKKRDSLSKMTAPRTKDKSDIANSPELVQIKKFFADNKEEFRKNTELMSIAKSLIDVFVEEDFLLYFLPALMLFFLRFLDIYDSAIQGYKVDDYLKLIKNPAAANPLDKSEEDAIKLAVGDKVLKEFGKKEFWERRYADAKDGFDPHDWYLTWETLRAKILSKTNLKTTTTPLTILELGCGLSKLAEDIVQDPEANVKKFVCIDFVYKPIELQQRRADERDLDTKLSFELMDATNLKFSAKSFDMVIEKGTLDSIICADPSLKSLNSTLQGVSKVLRPEGYFVVVSCAITYDKLGIFDRPAYEWRVLHVADFSAEKNENQKITVIIIQKNK